MLIAGFGFRESADVASLKDALAAAGGMKGVVAFATADAKAGTGAGATALRTLAEECGVPVIAVTPAAMMAAETLTRSDRVIERFGTGSVAEAAALAAGGRGARLLGPRAVSSDGMATAALAIAEPGAREGT